MLKKLFITIVFPGSAMLFAQEGILKINVSDKMKGEFLEAANVVVENAGTKTCSGITDSDGNVVFKHLSSGTYDVKAIYTGYQKNMISGVLIKNNETTSLEIKLSSENIIDDFVIIEYKKPLIDPNTSIKTTFTYEDIQKSPIRNVNDFMATAPGAVQVGDGTIPHFRGARSTSVIYIVDGQPMPASYQPSFGSIEQMSVILGGVPAQYGDATGAFIEIETRSGLVKH